MKLTANEKAHETCQQRQERSIRPNAMAIIVEQSFQDSRVNYVTMS